MQATSATKKPEYSPMDTAQEALNKGREAAQEAVAMGRNAAQQAMDHGRDAVQQRFDAASEWASSQTKNNPMRALGVAAAVGAVVGLLLARR